MTLSLVWSQIIDNIPKDNPIVLTGSTSNIGKALVKLLCEDGYKVIAVTNSNERFNQLYMRRMSSYGN